MTLNNVKHITFERSIWDHCSSFEHMKFFIFLQWSQMLCLKVIHYFSVSFETECQCRMEFGFLIFMLLTLLIHFLSSNKGWWVSIENCSGITSVDGSVCLFYAVGNQPMIHGKINKRWRMDYHKLNIHRHSFVRSAPPTDDAPSQEGILVTCRLEMETSIDDLGRLETQKWSCTR